MIYTVDIPGAFMQSDMDDFVIMKIQGKPALLLTRVNAKYKKFLIMEKGRPTIYVRLVKALYGTVQAAFLFWCDLSKELSKMGFTTNPYDPCVANKMVNNKQCTIIWHVDDLKISHAEESVVKSVVSELTKRYGKVKSLTVNSGKVHDYLGMTLDYSDYGKVMIKMFDYVDKLIAEGKKDMEGEAITPAGDNLFVVDPNGVTLSGADKEEFHTITAKLLFLAKRARPDVLTATAYLTTRVNRSTNDDWKKLCRIIKYLRHTRRMYLTLEADETNVVKWWVDGSYGVHPDMKSQTGATMSLGKGSVYSSSTKQKLNTRSSTEAELVAVDDAMPHILWTQRFLQHQGYSSGDPATVYQDNMSAMLLEKNGRRSSGRRTRHLDIRYFL